LKARTGQRLRKRILSPVSGACPVLPFAGFSQIHFPKCKIAEINAEAL
jgi:hypothetical protein